MFFMNGLRRFENRPIKDYRIIKWLLLISMCILAGLLTIVVTSIDFTCFFEAHVVGILFVLESVWVIQIYGGFISQTFSYFSAIK